MTTRADRQVDQDLNNKLRLEKTFKPEIRSIFSRMMKSFAVNVARTGRAPDASLYRGEWEGALRKQYTRVQKMFSGSVRNFQGKFIPDWNLKQDDDLTSEQLVAFLFSLQKWTDERAPQSAEIITATNQKNYSDSIDRARKALLEGEEEFDDRDLSLTAVAFLRRSFGSRIETIATVETQASAEATKLIEAEVTAGLEPSILRPLIPIAVVTAMKTWRTVGDNRVRTEPFNHRAANFQEKKITEPFVVSGELLMHPGDTSLDASIGNIAGCRCSAIYNL